MSPAAAACPSTAYWVARFGAATSTLTAQLSLQAGLEGGDHVAYVGNVGRFQQSAVSALQAEVLTPREASGLTTLAPDDLVGLPARAAATHTQPESLRAGYEALSVDVGSMRRLRITKGIYLPADTAMHGIFGSKDVIHSWAIPGLGVKIDCIPGYSSHRRLILRWRGLF